MTAVNYSTLYGNEFLVLKLRLTLPKLIGILPKGPLVWTPVPLAPVSLVNASKDEDGLGPVLVFYVFFPKSPRKINVDVFPKRVKRQHETRDIYAQQNSYKCSLLVRGFSFHKIT